jgi:hypothetical protein
MFYYLAEVLGGLSSDLSLDKSQFLQSTLNRELVDDATSYEGTNFAADETQLLQVVREWSIQ